MRRTLVRIAEQRILLLRFGGRLFLLLLGGQTLDDRLLALRFVGPLELEIEPRQQDVRLHVIGQYGADLLEQFDRLVGFTLGLDQLRQLKERASVVRPEFERAPQKRLRFFQLPVLSVEPAEADVGDEIARVEFKLLFELLNRQFARAGEQITHAELRGRGRQLRVELRRALQLLDRGRKLAARQVEQPEYQMSLGGAEFLEDLVDQRAPFLDLFVQQVGRGQRVG